jgi:hypothetical protein
MQEYNFKVIEDNKVPTVNATADVLSRLCVDKEEDVAQANSPVKRTTNELKNGFVNVKVPS